MTAATTRALYTIEGGALALVVYAIWPTWSATSARASLAAMLDAHERYVNALLTAYSNPASINLGRLAEIRADARLVRSNAEAVVERMLAEPPGRAAIPPRVAMGLLAALRRHSLAGLALHAGLEHGIAHPVRGLEALTEQITTSLSALAAAVRSGTVPPRLPPLRQTQLALAEGGDSLVGEETDLMVDSINTIAELLTPHPVPTD